MRSRAANRGSLRGCRFSQGVQVGGFQAVSCGRGGKPLKSKTATSLEPEGPIRSWRWNRAHPGSHKRSSRDRQASCACKECHRGCLESPGSSSPQYRPQPWIARAPSGTALQCAPCLVWQVRIGCQPATGCAARFSLLSQMVRPPRKSIRCRIARSYSRDAHDQIKSIGAPPLRRFALSAACWSRFLRRYGSLQISQLSEPTTALSWRRTNQIASGGRRIHCKSGVRPTPTTGTVGIVSAYLQPQAGSMD